MTSAKQTGRRRPHRGQQTQRFQGELRRILEIRRDVVDPRGIAAGAGRAEDDEQQNDAEGVAHESLASAFGIVAAAGLDEALHYEQMLEVFCEAMGILPKAHQRAKRCSGVP